MQLFFYVDINLIKIISGPGKLDKYQEPAIITIFDLFSSHAGWPPPSGSTEQILQPLEVECAPTQFTELIDTVCSNFLKI